MKKKISRFVISAGGCTLLGIFTYIIFFSPPSFNMTLGNFVLPVLYCIPFILWGGLFFLIWGISGKWVQGISISIALCGYLIMRFFGITHWFFGLLLLLVFTLLEVLLHQS